MEEPWAAYFLVALGKSRGLSEPRFSGLKGELEN